MAPAIFSALAFVASIQAGPTDSSQLVTREAWVMGTRLSVIVEATSLADASQASENVIREVERLERMLSTWDPQSEMHAINTAEVGQPVTPAPELAALLTEAERYSRTSHAAFDARVGALVDAWDLRGAGDVPAARELLAARNATGAGAMSIDERTGVVVRHMPAAWIDTGGFGKGAALRAAARRLEADGVDRALIDLGGQLWAQGSAQKPWSVYIAHPEQRQRRVARLEVHGVSVATSGTSERFIEAEGMRWGHILDPRTGQPAPAWGSVTVVSADPVEADVRQAAAFQQAFDDYAADCAQSPDCPLGTDPDKAVEVYQDLVEPLVDDPAETDDPRGLSYNDAIVGTILPLYSPSLWRHLTQGLTELQEGRGDTMLTLADLYMGRDAQGRYNNSTDARVAVNCVDKPAITDRETIVEQDRRIREAAPFMSYGEFTGYAPMSTCGFWPVPPTSTPHEIKVNGLPPILVVSTTNDPATPYQAGVDLAKQPGGTLLTYEGTQHTVVLQGDSCVDEISAEYLIDLTVPPPGTRC